ncbi:hypothetical protein NC796_07530 [Aliifodinibius sp. S!AR15-10]|uniref:hypothetical protein n=1 Tax=Aliifodinibius sp. S!AR15-10 TaxID=2950437 RepID=UPI002858A5AA|nr:hypothetical protein [Aliifodinibius sp. S!AR15-10]MDR8390983.1 hypothetical protein [Aliifodinibius sp. S!AR15-10]
MTKDKELNKRIKEISKALQDSSIAAKEFADSAKRANIAGIELKDILKKYAS